MTFDIAVPTFSLLVQEVFQEVAPMNFCAVNIPNSSIHKQGFSLPDTKGSIFFLAINTHLKKYLLPPPNPGYSPVHRLFLGSGLS